LVGGLYVKWKSSFWNPNKKYIYILLKPWPGIKKFQGQGLRFQGLKLIWFRGQ
jgi:hypothetical protein